VRQPVIIPDTRDCGPDCERRTARDRWIAANRAAMARPATRPLAYRLQLARVGTMTTATKLAIVLGVLIGLGAVGSFLGEAGVLPGTGAQEVVVNVDGPRYGDITLDIDGHIRQHTGVDFPLHHSDGTEGLHYHLRPGTRVGITAQGSSGENGPITCEIIRDGETIDRETSTGRYAVVTCSGTV